METDQGESIRFWLTAPFAGVELLLQAQLAAPPSLEELAADQSHLSRQFKQVYGVGPGAYRSARLR